MVNKQKNYFYHWWKMTKTNDCQQVYNLGLLDRPWTERNRRQGTIHGPPARPKENSSSLTLLSFSRFFSPPYKPGQNLLKPLPSSSRLPSRSKHRDSPPLLPNSSRVSPSFSFSIPEWPTPSSFFFFSFIARGNV